MVDDKTKVVNPELERLMRDATATSLREPILNERELTHGKFENTAFIAQTLKYYLRKYTISKPNAIQQEALDMICSKIARICSGNPAEVDHWRDISGYAKLGEEGCKGPEEKL